MPKELLKGGEKKFGEISGYGQIDYGLGETIAVHFQLWSARTQVSSSFWSGLTSGRIIATAMMTTIIYFLNYKFTI